ncbi:fyve zinc finger domain-containing protein [Cystoisospora suis]|uniref:Fyve zinc finger domain-containing protein n=1 Tax=Cystoisospora suis TaxID=483139 RepID=A0A2C6L1Y3_9APIC|nr:fyve zinc finger domain-containing protein [Cystoisospora suis]
MKMEMFLMDGLSGYYYGEGGIDSCLVDKNSREDQEQEENEEGEVDEEEIHRDTRKSLGMQGSERDQRSHLSPQGCQKQDTHPTHFFSIPSSSSSASFPPSTSFPSPSHPHPCSSSSSVTSPSVTSSSTNPTGTSPSTSWRHLSGLSRFFGLFRGDKGEEDLPPQKAWMMPDAHCSMCYDCGVSFSTFLRRHHCRQCGLVFCLNCSGFFVDGEYLGYSGRIRLCRFCFELRNYSRSNKGDEEQDAEEEEEEENRDEELEALSLYEEEEDEEEKEERKEEKQSRWMRCKSDDVNDHRSLSHDVEKQEKNGLGIQEIEGQRWRRESKRIRYNTDELSSSWSSDERLQESSDLNCSSSSSGRRHGRRVVSTSSSDSSSCSSQSTSSSFSEERESQVSRTRQPVYRHRTSSSMGVPEKPRKKRRKKRKDNNLLDIELSSSSPSLLHPSPNHLPCVCTAGEAAWYHLKTSIDLHCRLVGLSSLHAQVLFDLTLAVIPRLRLASSSFSCSSSSLFDLIKIKRLPGLSISDSFFVNGVVFPHFLQWKSQENLFLYRPRVLLLSFYLGFTRDHPSPSVSICPRLSNTSHSTCSSSSIPSHPSTEGHNSHLFSSSISSFSPPSSSSSLYYTSFSHSDKPSPSLGSSSMSCDLLHHSSHTFSYGSTSNANPSSSSFITSGPAEGISSSLGEGEGLGGQQSYLSFYPRKKVIQLQLLREQEEVFSDMLIKKILAIRPSLILSSHGASHMIQERLRNLGICFFPHVSLKTLKRVSRCTGASILTSIDQAAVKAVLLEREKRKRAREEEALAHERNIKEGFYMDKNDGVVARRREEMTSRTKDKLQRGEKRFLSDKEEGGRPSSFLSRRSNTKKMGSSHEVLETIEEEEQGKEDYPSARLDTKKRREKVPWGMAGLCGVGKPPASCMSGCCPPLVFIANCPPSRGATICLRGGGRKLAISQTFAPSPSTSVSSGLDHESNCETSHQGNEAVDKHEGRWPGSRRNEEIKQIEAEEEMKKKRGKKGLTPDLSDELFLSKRVLQRALVHALSLQQELNLISASCEFLHRRDRREWLRYFSFSPPSPYPSSMTDRRFESSEEAYLISPDGAHHPRGYGYLPALPYSRSRGKERRKENEERRKRRGSHESWGRRKVLCSAPSCVFSERNEAGGEKKPSEDTSYRGRRRQCCCVLMKRPPGVEVTWRKKDGEKKEKEEQEQEGLEEGKESEDEGRFKERENDRETFYYTEKNIRDSKRQDRRKREEKIDPAAISSSSEPSCSRRQFTIPPLSSFHSSHTHRSRSFSSSFSSTNCPSPLVSLVDLFSIVPLLSSDSFSDSSSFLASLVLLGTALHSVPLVDWLRFSFSSPLRRPSSLQLLSHFLSLQSITDSTAHVFAFLSDREKQERHVLYDEPSPHVSSPSACCGAYQGGRSPGCISSSSTSIAGGDLPSPLSSQKAVKDKEDSCCFSSLSSPPPPVYKPTALSITTRPCITSSHETSDRGEETSSSQSIDRATSSSLSLHIDPIPSRPRGEKSLYAFSPVSLYTPHSSPSFLQFYSTVSHLFPYLSLLASKVSEREYREFLSHSLSCSQQRQQSYLSSLSSLRPSFPSLSFDDLPGLCDREEIFLRSFLTAYKMMGFTSSNPVSNCISSSHASKRKNRVVDDDVHGRRRKTREEGCLSRSCSRHLSHVHHRRGGGSTRSATAMHVEIKAALGTLLRKISLEKRTKSSYSFSPLSSSSLSSSSFSSLSSFSLSFHKSMLDMYTALSPCVDTSSSNQVATFLAIFLLSAYIIDCLHPFLIAVQLMCIYSPSNGGQFVQVLSSWSCNKQQCACHPQQHGPLPLVQQLPLSSSSSLSSPLSFLSPSVVSSQDCSSSSYSSLQNGYTVYYHRDEDRRAQSDEKAVSSYLSSPYTSSPSPLPHSPNSSPEDKGSCMTHNDSYGYERRAAGGVRDASMTTASRDRSLEREGRERREDDRDRIATGRHSSEDRPTCTDRASMVKMSASLVYHTTTGITEKGTEVSSPFTGCGSSGLRGEEREKEEERQIVKTAPLPTLREVIRQRCTVAAGLLSQKKCPGGSTRCKKSLLQHTLRMQRFDSRIIVTFGQVSTCISFHVGFVHLSFSSFLTSLSISSVLPRRSLTSPCLAIPTSPSFVW